MSRSQYWSLTAGSALALILVFANMALYLGNRELQSQANNRAQYIQQSIAVEGLYRATVEALVGRARRTQDNQVREMLAGEGIDFTLESPPAQPPAAATGETR